MQAYFNSPLMDVFSTLLNQNVVDSLDFQTFNEQARRRCASAPVKRVEWRFFTGRNVKHGA